MRLPFPIVRAAARIKPNLPGGLLPLLLAEDGTDVRVVVLTDGEATIGSPWGRAETAARRRRDTDAACRALGVAPPTFLRFATGT